MKNFIIQLNNKKKKKINLSSFITVAIRCIHFSLRFILTLTRYQTVQKFFNLTIPIARIFFLGNFTGLQQFGIFTSWRILEIIYTRGACSRLVLSLFGNRSVLFASLLLFTFIYEHLFMFALGLLFCQHFQKLFWICKLFRVLLLLRFYWCLLLVN